MKHLALAAILFLLACNSTKPASEEAPATNTQPVAEATATAATTAAAPTAATATTAAAQGLTLVAEEITVQDTGHDNDPTARPSEIEGTISGISAVSGCPVVTFMIGTTQVTTSATTTFDDVTCATLANGALVEVEGAKQADGSIVATRVEAEAGPDEVTGTVFEFSGAASCPAATFKVGPVLSLATAVTLTPTTTFSGVTCAAIANGAMVEIEGTKQVDGSITAANVELK